MPELPEVETVRRNLDPVMHRARFEAVIVRRPNLRIPFPPHFSDRLTGQRVLTLTRRAKYLLAGIASGETLVMHLGMSGSFAIAVDQDERGEPRPHDHVIFHMSSGAIVTFNDPRRFGFMDIVPAEQLEAYPPLAGLGPEPLAEEFDGAALARACRGKKIPLKVALLDQRVVAGLGNIYVSEALHLARLSPQRLARTIATPSGLPRQSAHRLVAAIKQVLKKAIARASSDDYRGARFRVYDREGEGCRTPRCGGVIKRRTQAGRSTFYCATCQR